MDVHTPGGPVCDSRAEPRGGDGDLFLRRSSRRPPGTWWGRRHQQLYVSGRPTPRNLALGCYNAHSSNNEAVSPAHTRDQRAVSKPVRHPGGTPNSQQRGLRRSRKEKTNSEVAAARVWQRRHTEVVVAARGGAYIATQTRLHS